MWTWRPTGWCTMSEFGRDSLREKMSVESLGASTLEKRYGVSLNESNSWNFGLEMTIREYENSLFQIEKLEANIKDLKLEVNHLQSAKQRADNQVGKTIENSIIWWDLTVYQYWCIIFLWFVFPALWTAERCWAFEIWFVGSPFSVQRLCTRGKYKLRYPQNTSKII